MIFLTANTTFPFALYDHSNFNAFGANKDGVIYPPLIENWR